MGFGVNGFRHLLCFCMALASAPLCLGGQSDYLDGTAGGDLLGSDLEPQTTKNVKLSPIVVPFYTPELQLGVAAGGVVSWRTEPGNEALPRSNVRATAMYSTRDALGLKVQTHTFWLDDMLRGEVSIGAKDAVDDYYGVGYDAGFGVEAGEETTEYSYEGFVFRPIVTYRTFGDFFAGINGEANYINATEVNPVMASDPAFEASGPSYWSSGLGLTLSYDSRDVTVNAWDGHFFQFRTTHFLEALGSDNEFNRYNLDFRKYWQIRRDGRTLALKVEGEFVDGDTPWSMLPIVGGSHRLRGYGKGRFRDETMTLAVLEYRHMWGRKEGGYRRHGFVTWVGLGVIGEDIGDFSGHELPNAGLGYRFEVQSRLNARVDFGFGDDDTGFYFSINEAF